ncbi:MAG: acyl-CoA dehydrogenase family protein [Acidimicrobiales bacterium]
MPSAPDLAAAAAAVDQAATVLTGAAAHLAASGGVDANQWAAYDLAHAAAAVEAARAILGYGARGPVEAAIACAFVAEAAYDVATRLLGREAEWGAAPAAMDGPMGFARTYRGASFLCKLAGQLGHGGPAGALGGPRHLDDDLEMVQDLFRRFADEKLKPVAEHIHRHNTDIPEEIISGLAELGAFGLSIPEAYGGFSTGGDGEYLAMVVATEELSRGSLGAGGSLITRPEILTRALVKGGTEEQKATWLPKLASAEVMNAVAVTEPDHGSDVANLKVTARPVDGGWVIDGVKTWCTFAARADVLMVLARTDEDRSKAHRGLTLFVVPKERADPHGFVLTQPGGGRMEGRPIDTIGYRGMHSYEVAFESWLVGTEHQVGGEAGLGRGFYLQMEGFENGRLQTAARAVGVMQAAYEAAVAYAGNRVAFGSPIDHYQLTQVKLARMAVVIQASRQLSHAVAAKMAQGEGATEASMLKTYVCRAAEWVTREAMQIHGGMGYAEEYDVSRYFLDARVLSIFEGADETLALKVVARRLLQAAAG